MNFDESVKILTIISANFPYYYKNIGKAETKIIANTWQKTFHDVPAVLVMEALQRAIPKNTYPPTIAHINQELEKMYLGYSMLGNDMKLTQEERTEASRIENLLYDLGFAPRGNRAYRVNKELLSLGGLNALRLEEE